MKLIDADCALEEILRADVSGLSALEVKKKLKDILIEQQVAMILTDDKRTLTEQMKDPLELLKLQCVLNGKIKVYEWRMENQPEKISDLDLTEIYALAYVIKHRYGGETDAFD